MQPTHLNEEQTETYLQLEKLARAIERAVSDFDLAVLRADIPDEVKVKCLEVTQGSGTRSLRGFAYLLHPQSEWMGGDSFKTRQPHIAA